MVHLLEEDAGRLRIVVDAPPGARRLFEARVPTDATLPELEAFHAELVRIIGRRRASEAITKNERGPR